MPDTADRLTEKQRRFAEEYLLDGNASAAARRAGYAPSKAGNSGYDNLHNPFILEIIAQKRRELSKRLDIQINDVIRELALIAFAPIDSEHVTITDKRLALVDIGRHLGAFSRDIGDGEERGVLSAEPLNVDEWAAKHGATIQ